jgi:hypothetical protein
MKKDCHGSFVVSLGTAVLFICCWNETKADTIAFAPTSLSFISGEPAGNDGLFFTPTVNISVTELGYIDGGFSVGHPVGLYDVTTSILLASTTITGSSTLTSNFRYNLITPITLTAGDQYAIVGTFTPGTGPDRGYQAVSAGAASQITYQGYKYDTSSTLNLPTTSYPSPIFGPDFQYVIAVPEPATTGCFLLGLGVLACFKRLRI